VQVRADGMTRLDLPMRDNDVVMVELSRRCYRKCSTGSSRKAS
jgi:hypothetical protein